MKSVSIKKGLFHFAIRSGEYLKSYARIASRNLRRVYFTYLTSKSVRYYWLIKHLPPPPSGRQWRIGWGRFREEIKLLLLLQAGRNTSATHSFSHHSNYPCLCQFCVFHLGVSLVQLHINRGWCQSQPSRRSIFKICLSNQFKYILNLVLLASIKAMSLSFSTTLHE
jgi:hypothetical protein